MDGDAIRTAVIIGASSGIGEALAHELNRDGWRLGLLARRLDRLEALRQALAPDTVVRRLDVSEDDAASILDRLLDELGGVDGLRDLVRQSGLPIAVTEVQPGAVDTAMLKTERPLPTAVRWILVSSPATAAQQIMRAVRKRAKHAYITRRYGVVAFILKLLPRVG